MSKQCRRCHKHQPDSNFYYSPSKQSHAIYCRDCERQRYRDYYHHRGGNRVRAAAGNTEAKRRYDNKRRYTETRLNQRKARYHNQQIQLICQKCHSSFLRHQDRQHLPRICHNCRGGGFNTNLDGYLYLLVHDDGFHKYGITNCPTERLTVHRRFGYHPINLIGPLPGQLIADAERHIKIVQRQQNVPQAANAPTDGHTETIAVGQDPKPLWDAALTILNTHPQTPSSHTGNAQSTHHKTRRTE